MRPSDFLQLVLQATGKKSTCDEPRRCKGDVEEED